MNRFAQAIKNLHWTVQTPEEGPNGTGAAAAYSWYKRRARRGGSQRGEAHATEEGMQTDAEEAPFLRLRLKAAHKRWVVETEGGHATLPHHRLCTQDGGKGHAQTHPLYSVLFARRKRRGRNANAGTGNSPSYSRTRPPSAVALPHKWEQESRTGGFQTKGGCIQTTEGGGAHQRKRKGRSACVWCDGAVSKSDVV